MIAHLPSWHAFVLLALYPLLIRVMASSSDDLAKSIATAVNDAMSAAHIAPKVIAGLWGCSVTRVYQVLSGDPAAPITLAKLMVLPPTFWLYFAPWLAARVAQQRMEEIVDVFKSVRS